MASTGVLSVATMPAPVMAAVRNRTMNRLRTENSMIFSIMEKSPGTGFDRTPRRLVASLFVQLGNEGLPIFHFELALDVVARFDICQQTSFFHDELHFHRLHESRDVFVFEHYRFFVRVQRDDFAFHVIGFLLRTSRTSLAARQEHGGQEQRVPTCQFHNLSFGWMERPTGSLRVSAPFQLRALLRVIGK